MRGPYKLGWEVVLSSYEGRLSCNRYKQAGRGGDSGYSSHLPSIEFGRPETILLLFHLVGVWPAEDGCCGVVRHAGRAGTSAQGGSAIGHNQRAEQRTALEFNGARQVGVDVR